MEPIILTADDLDTELVQYLSRAYLVEVWESEDGRINYKLSKYQNNGTVI